MTWDEIRFEIPGRPRAKGRIRCTHGGRAYTPATTRQYERHVRECAEMEMDGLMATDEPVTVSVVFRFRIPSGYSRAQRKLARLYGWYTHKPDVDNMVKSVLDGMNGVVYEDDSQVVAVVAVKFYDDVGDGVSVSVMHANMGENDA